MNGEGGFALGIIAGGALVLGLFLAAPDACQLVTPPSTAEYAAKGDIPGQRPRGGYWIADGEVIAFAYAEDDPAKTVACFPELDENDK
jgi:hypothetical protein